MTALAFLGGSFGGGEVILILLVALLLFGAKNLPKIARSLGKSLEEFKRAARDVQHEITRADADEDEAKPKPAPAKLPDPELKTTPQADAVPQNTQNTQKKDHEG
jgi:sec-independent protein translocase protein TatA